MSNNVQNTLFRLGVSLSTKAKDRNQLFDTISSILSVGNKEKIAVCIYSTIIESMRDFMKSGFELQKIQPPKYVEAAKQFQKASQLADSLLDITEKINSNTEKAELSEVYAQFAFSLKKHAPHLDSKEEMVKKSLVLDPNNAIANELKFDMGFDEYIHEQNRLL